MIDRVILAGMVRYAWILACLGMMGCDSPAPSEARPAPASANAKPDANPDTSASTSCDRAGFAALAQRLSASASADRPALAARGLIERCDGELPPRLRWAIRTLLPEHESELMRTPKPDPAEDAVWDAACAHHAEVLAALVETPSRERPAMLYTRCDLARYDLISQAELATRMPSGLPLWVAHQWLLDHGASKADARAISVGLFDAWDLAAQALAAGP